VAESPDIRQIDVIAPNFKRRLSGVTATVVRLVPLQANAIHITSLGPGLPPHVPRVSVWSVLTMSRRGPSGFRIWHARRNVEAVVGLLLKTVLRKKLKCVFTSAAQRDHTNFTKWLFSRMDAVIATSPQADSFLRRDATVILHGIDTEAFSPPADKAALRATLGLPSGTLLGCFGRVRENKGTDLFVAAMIESIRDHGLDACGIVLGRATEQHMGFERDLKRRIADAGLTDRILFLGEKPVHDMARWYQALDLFVAPSREEGFGLTPLEAMACGVPVIASRAGAYEDIVDDGVTGRLVDTGDLAAMTHAMHTFAADAEQLRTAGEASRTRVEAVFPIQREADLIIDVYRNLAGIGSA
jgi:mannosyltransferase